jgi:hypothetical protein
VLLRPGDTAAVAEILGIVADPLSPLYGLLQRAGEAPGEGTGLVGQVRRHEGDDAQALADLAATLWTLAVPRQLLIVQSNHGDADPLAFYLNDGERLVRFLLADEECLIDGWWSPAVFHHALSTWLGAPQESAAAVQRVADRLVRALAGLLDAGLDRAGATAISRAEAEAAIAPALADEAEPAMAFDGLVDDGVIAVDGGDVRLRKDWVDRYNYLFESPQLTIHAIELADVQVGLWRPTSLAVLGGGDRRVCVVPPFVHDHPGVLLAMASLTEAALGDALDALLSRPLEPPSTPTTSYVGDPASWLAALGDQDARVSLPGFDDVILPPVVTTDDGTPERALLQPGATIELVVGAGAITQTERVVLALDGHHAVEWTMRGSTIRRRSLDVVQVGARLRALLPAEGDGTAPQVAVELTVEQTAALMSGRAFAGADDLPAVLLAAATAPDVRRHTVDARRLAGTVLSGVVLLVLASPEHGMWRLEPTATGFVAQGADRGEIVDELLTALMAQGS